MSSARTSPFEPLWRKRAEKLAHRFGMEIPARCGDERDERTQLDRIGVIDVSPVPRSTLKGRAASDVLLASGWPVPTAWFEAAPHPGASGLDRWSFVARVGGSEFLVEGPGELAPGSLRYPRQDGSLLLAGRMVGRLLAEAVSIPIDLSVSKLHLTVLAGANCALLPRPHLRRPAVQLWVDPTFALYLGKTLLDRAEELGGGWVGHDTADGQELLPKGRNAEEMTV